MWATPLLFFHDPDFFGKEGMPWSPPFFKEEYPQGEVVMRPRLGWLARAGQVLRVVAQGRYCVHLCLAGIVCANELPVLRACTTPGCLGLRLVPTGPLLKTRGESRATCSARVCILEKLRSVGNSPPVFRRGGGMRRMPNVDGVVYSRTSGTKSK